MVLIINKQTVSEKVKVAIGYNEADFDKYINEAQEFDFKKLVSEDFYFDLLHFKNETNYLKLIQGGEYQWNNRTYNFQGIATVLSYFTYARYFIDSPMVPTSFGVVVKTNPNSEPVSLEDRRNVYYKKREEANSLMVDVVKYIERNIIDFPSWKNGSTCKTSSNNTFGFSTKVIQ